MISLMKWRHLPNIVSFSRLMMVIPIAYCIVHQSFGYALILFLIAGLSDGIDGFLARKFNWESGFGKMFDPLADKLLVLGVAAAMVYTGYLPMMLMGLILVKDLLLISGILIYTMLAGFPEMKPLMIGKVTTALQLILIGFLLIVSNVSVAGQPAFESWMTSGLFWLVAITTFLDGVVYLWVWNGKLRIDQRYYLPTGDN